MNVSIKNTGDTAICVLTKKSYMTGKTQYGVGLSKNEVMKIADDFKSKGMSASRRQLRFP